MAMTKVPGAALAGDGGDEAREARVALQAAVLLHGGALVNRYLDAVAAGDRLEARRVMGIIRAVRRLRGAPALMLPR